MRYYPTKHHVVGATAGLTLIILIFGNAVSHPKSASISPTPTEAVQETTPTAGQSALLTPILDDQSNLPAPAATDPCSSASRENLAHVYHPYRLIVHKDCVTVTGTVVSDTTHTPDGVRHEKDGDTHMWLKLDKQYENLLNAGDTTYEAGNMVVEFVCEYNVTQVDADQSGQPGCYGYTDTLTIPRVGQRISLTGQYVQDTNHGQWNEIHPVYTWSVIN